MFPGVLAVKRIQPSLKQGEIHLVAAAGRHEGVIQMMGPVLSTRFPELREGDTILYENPRKVFAGLDIVYVTEVLCQKVNS